jgi:NOL1/NOP2/fmu family ribosome biogenesis protein
MKPSNELRKIADQLEGKTVWGELSKKTGLELTEQNYEDWLNGDSTYALFDNAVKQFLNEDAYNEAEASNCLVPYLDFKLGLGPDKANGVEFLK